MNLVGRNLAVPRVFAVISFRKLNRDSLLAPYLSSGALGVLAEMLIPLLKVSIDGVLCGFQGRIIAVVYYAPGHTAKYRLNYVQKLRTSGQGCGFHGGTAILVSLAVDAVQMGEESL